MALLNADKLFYYPNRVEYGSPRSQRLAYESVGFDTSDGYRLHGWFFPARGEATGTVLHLHGNAGNISGHFQHMAWLPSAGWNVLCFDYRGYGNSEGQISRDGTMVDAHAALDYLLQREDVDSERVVLFGQSLGAAVAITLAAKRPEVRGVVSDGSFDGYRNIARWHIRHNLLLLVVGWWVPRWLMTDGWDPIDFVGEIAPRPVMIMHGMRDRVVPVAMARRLYDAANEPKELWLVEGADHYEAMQDMPEEAHPKLLRFFDRCVNGEG